MNIGNERQVWGRPGRTCRGEGVDQIVSVKFYRSVVQVVIMFGSETWVLSMAKEKRSVGVYMGFLMKGDG